MKNVSLQLGVMVPVLEMRQLPGCKMGYEEAPLFEADVPCFQADDIARVEIIGPRVSVVFVEYQFVGGVVVRMPVVCLKRIITDIPPESLARWETRGIVSRYMGRQTRRLM